MFILRYIASEVRRRKARAILTALGLGLGVALVIVVGALSQGLDDAQDEILTPLTGLGTDMSIARPLRLEGGEPIQLGPDGNLTDEERELLQEENVGAGRIPFNELGEAGEEFSIDRFTTFELSFPADDAATVAGLEGVAATARELTLDLQHVEGTVPEGGGFGGPGGAGRAGAGAGGFDFSTARITGIDLTNADVVAVTPGEIVDGDYFSGDGADQAVVDEAYAGREEIAVGDEITLAENDYRVVGLSSAPLGGQTSDVYLELTELQNASGREGRVNRLRVRAVDAGQVDTVAANIESRLSGSRVTTASDLADRIQGSLVDARSLAETLGTALAAVALISAIALATLLTLNSVAKRTRELGTLRAIGWSRARVVGQVTGEAVAIGFLGALVGVVLGLGGARVASALVPSLEASLPSSSAVALPGGGGGRFGLGDIGETPAQAVSVGAPIDMGLLMAGVGLAILGGAIAGAVAGLRASRLRPSEALRSVD